MKKLVVIATLLSIGQLFAAEDSCKKFESLIEDEAYYIKFMQGVRTVIISNREAADYQAYTGGETIDPLPLNLNTLSIVQCHEYKSPSKYVIEFEIEDYDSFCYYTPEYIRSPFRSRCDKKNGKFSTL